MKVELIKNTEVDFGVYVNNQERDSNGRIIINNLKFDGTPYEELPELDLFEKALSYITQKYPHDEFCYLIIGEAYNSNEMNIKVSLTETLKFFKRNTNRKLKVSTNNLSSDLSNSIHIPTVFWIGKSHDKSTLIEKDFSNHFLIMMNSMRDWRVEFLNQLESSDVLSKSLYSFNAINIPNFGNEYKTIEGYPLLESDREKQEEIFHVKDYFHKTFLNVIVETYFTDNRIFLTEKTDKPLLAKQPFIMVGGYKTLDVLKQIGFKTFDKWWSEDYDLIKNPKDRMEEIVKILNQIKEWDLDKCRKVYEEMLPIIEHNYERRMWIKNNHQHMNSYSDFKYLQKAQLI